MTRNFHDQLNTFLEHLPQRRMMRESVPGPEGTVEVDGQRLINFSSNDYLGLSRHPRLVQATRDWAEKYGTGATASRLITGNHPGHSSIERKLTELTGHPAALLMNSGFMANSSVLAALLDHRLHGGRAGDGRIQVFADRLVHSSIHFGLAAAGVRQQRYRHNDRSHLKQLLESSTADDACRLIVTESVFSMDGDTADISSLRQLADEYQALLYIDDAHAFGVFGPGGGGLAATPVSGSDHRSPARMEVVVGTFGKALGSFGAWVASDDNVREYLINRCQGLVYATALPPGLLGAIDAGLDLVSEMNEPREHLQTLAAGFRAQLNDAGIDTLGSNTQIVPVMIGDDELTMRVAGELLEQGFLVGAIRPPTVPPGTARLRVTFSAVHQSAQVDDLAEAIIRVMKCQLTA